MTQAILQMIMDQKNDVLEGRSSLCCWASTMSFTVVTYTSYCPLVFIFCRSCSRLTSVIWGIPIWDLRGKVMCSRPESMAIDLLGKTYWCWRKVFLDPGSSWNSETSLLDEFFWTFTRSIDGNCLTDRCIDKMTVIVQLINNLFGVDDFHGT